MHELFCHCVDRHRTHWRVAMATNSTHNTKKEKTKIILSNFSVRNLFRARSSSLGCSPSAMHFRNSLSQNNKRKILKNSPLRAHFRSKRTTKAFTLNSTIVIMLFQRARRGKKFFFASLVPPATPSREGREGFSHSAARNNIKRKAIENGKPEFGSTQHGGWLGKSW